MRRRRTLAVAVLLVGLALGGCSPAPPAVAPSATAASTVTVTPSPSGSTLAAPAFPAPGPTVADERAAMLQGRLDSAVAAGTSCPRAHCLRSRTAPATLPRKHAGGGTPYPYSAILLVWTGERPASVAVLTPQPLDTATLAELAYALRI